MSEAVRRYDGHCSRAVTRYSCGSCATGPPLNSEFYNKQDGDPAPRGSTVTVRLTPVDGGTEVRLVHDGLTDEQAAQHPVGWNHFLGRLVAAGQLGDAGPDEWAAAPDPLDELV